MFAENGHNLLLVARDKKRLIQVKESIKEDVDIKVINLDLSMAESGKKLHEYVQKNNFSINILVNNAGFGDYSYFQKANQQKLLNMIDLNIRALTELTHLFLPTISKQPDSHILNVASVAAFLPGPGMAVYYATKHYVLAFSEGLAEELKNSKTSVTVLCPGPTASNFLSVSAMEKSSLVKDRKLPSARAVAEYGYKSMNNNKTVAVPFMSNKLASQAHRFLSRSFIARIVDRSQNG